MPFPGNVIPTDRLDPVGLTLAQQLASVGSGDVPSTSVTDVVGYQMSAKVNHTFSDAWQLAGTYLFYDSEEPLGNSYEPLLGSRPVFDPVIPLLRTVHALAINSTHIPGDTSVLTLRYGYTNFNDSLLSPEFTSAEAEALGWKGDWLSQIHIQNFPSSRSMAMGILLVARTVPSRASHKTTSRRR